MISRYALLLNSLTGTLLYAIGGTVSFIMAPFLVHHLTAGGYGFWELLMGIAGYLGILDMGISPAVLRYVALARGEANHARLLQVINTGFKTFLLAGFVGAALIGIVAIHPSWAFGNMPLPLSEGRWVIVVGALLFLVSFTRTTFTAALLGLQLHRLINAVRSGTALLQAGSVYLLLTTDNSHALLKVALVTLSLAVVETLCCAALLIRTVGMVSPRHVKWSDTKELFSFGSKSVGIMAASSLMRQGMLFVISHCMGPAMVTFYVLSSRLIDYGAALGGSVGYPITPYLASALGKSGVSGATEAYHLTTRAMQFIQAGIAMGVLWLGLPFLARWMGPEYAQKGATVFYILAGGTMMQIFGVNAARMLVSLNKHGRVAVGSAAFAVVAFLVALITVPLFGLPAAAACLTLYVTTLNLWELWLVSRTLQFSFWGSVASSIRQAAPPILAGSLVLCLLQRHYPALTYPRLILHVLAGGATYASVSILSMLSCEERRLCGEKILARLRLLRTSAPVPAVTRS
jgi:O-antigen/teichoic acid export membrane protein